ncbi:unnamed protein product [Hydatigera taeniaeformis]|uniref:UPAR/Ly6 domain-containing protein n=1 Tax=Hydatigena taeniaeformis TaxID=6205 RepID=A0A0R3WKN7_HYDTA|nr:unnamed protein product [Hydatigera taeniaeformis]
MSRGRVAFFLFLIALLTAALSVKALKCYQCESLKQKGCYPLDTKLIKPTECPLGSQVCTILRQEAQFKQVYGEEQEPKVRYLRGCSSEESKGSYYCVERAGTGSNTKNKYCTCDSDACNPAVKNAVLRGGLTVLMLLLISNLQ